MYSTIPRLTTKIGDNEYDEKRKLEKIEEKEQEEKVRKEIARRRKERCKLRNKEIHDDDDKIENTKNKRRRIDAEGCYKVVIQRNRAEKREDDEEKTEIEKEGKPAKGRKKRRKILNQGNEYKILGGEIKGAELAEKVDWEERRREILERLKKEEDERIEKVEKAQRLNRGWELNRLCREIIKENAKNWDEREEKQEKERIELEKKEKIEKAKYKQKEYREKRETTRKITDMMSSIPEVEAQKIEKEMRKKENLELNTMRKNIWRKWRGKSKVEERRTKIPKESEKLKAKLDEIEKMVEEYKSLKEERMEKMSRKQEEWRNKHKMILVEDSWGMMRWLTQFIEENKYEWERRRERERLPANEDLERLSNMDEEEMIRIVQEYEEKEKKEKESTQEKAARRRGYWKEWRKDEGEGNGDRDEAGGKMTEDPQDLQLVKCKQMTIEMMMKRKAWKVEKEKVIENMRERPGDPILDTTEPDPDKNPILEVDEQMVEELLGASRRALCMTCVHVPCLCMLRELEDKLSNIKILKELQQTGQVGINPNKEDPRNSKEAEEKEGRSEEDYHEEDVDEGTRPGFKAALKLFSNANTDNSSSYET